MVLEHVLPGLIAAALRHRRQQLEKNLRIELTQLKSDARKSCAGPFRLHQPLDSFIVLGIRIVNPIRRHLPPVFGLGRFTKGIDQFPGALAKGREDKQQHNVLFGQACCSPLKMRFTLGVIDNGAQRTANEVLVRMDLFFAGDDWGEREPQQFLEFLFRKDSAGRENTDHPRSVPASESCKIPDSVLKFAPLGQGVVRTC